jgi:hypothetical protein
MKDRERTRIARRTSQETRITKQKNAKRRKRDFFHGCFNFGCFIFWKEEETKPKFSDFARSLVY